MIEESPSPYKSTNITYESLLQIVRQWHIPSRISEKYSIWQLRHTEPQVPLSVSISCKSTGWD
jgi:hypothetical protein